MTEPINERCWEYYGFPDPALMTSRIPYLGLLRAFAERHLYVLDLYKKYGDTIRYPRHSPYSMIHYMNINNLDYELIFTSGSAGLSRLVVDNRYLNIDTDEFTPLDLYDMFAGFDQRLDWLSKIYLNQNKLNGIENISDQSDLTWTLDDLLLAAADGQQNAIIKYVDKLEPELSLRWIRQRYKALNLLRYIPIAYNIRRLYGYGPRSGKAGTVIDAYHAARSDVKEDSPASYLYVDVRSGFPKVWNDFNSGYYSAISCFSECGPVQEDIPENSESWLIANFKGSGSTRESFGLTLGKIQYGWNALKAENGVFLTYDITQIQDAEIPVVTGQISETKSVGWKPDSRIGGGYQIYAYADFNHSFYFKEEEEST